MVVLNARNLLLNNRALVQIFGGIVASRTNELHAALERAPIRIRADKGREK